MAEQQRQMGPQAAQLPPPSADTINIDDVAEQPPLVNPQAMQGNTKLVSRAAPILANSADGQAEAMRAASDKERFQGQSDVSAEINRGLAYLSTLTPTQAAQVQAQAAPGRDWMAELEHAQGLNRLQRMMGAGARLVASATGRNMPGQGPVDREGEVNRRMAVEEYINNRNAASNATAATERGAAEANDPNSSLSIASRRNLFATAQALNAAGMEDAARTTAAMANDPSVSHSTIARMAADETNPLQQILRAATTTNGQSLRFLSGRESNAARTDVAGLRAATTINSDTNDNAAALAMAQLRQARSSHGSSRGSGRGSSGRGGPVADSAMSRDDKARIIATADLLGHAGGEEAQIDAAAQEMGAANAADWIANRTANLLNTSNLQIQYDSAMRGETTVAQSGMRNRIAQVGKYRSQMANSQIGDYTSDGAPLTGSGRADLAKALTAHANLNSQTRSALDLMESMSGLEENSGVFTERGATLKTKLRELMLTYASANQGVFGVLHTHDIEMIGEVIAQPFTKAFVLDRVPVMLNEMLQNADTKLQNALKTNGVKYAPSSQRATTGRVVRPSAASTPAAEMTDEDALALKRREPSARMRRGPNGGWVRF